MSNDTLKHGILIITEYLVEWPKNYHSSSRDKNKFKTNLFGLKTYIPRDYEKEAAFVTNYCDHFMPQGGKIILP